MQLKELLSSLDVPHDTSISQVELELQTDLEIKDLQLDSRQVKPGDAFIAIPGILSDGRKFILDSINNGASAVIAESPKKNKENEYELAENVSRKVPIIYVDNLSEKIHLIAKKFYRENNNLSKIAITGTNGKTSIAHYIANIINNYIAIHQNNRPSNLGWLA